MINEVLDRDALERDVAAVGEQVEPGTIDHEGERVATAGRPTRTPGRATKSSGTCQPRRRARRHGRRRTLDSSRATRSCACCRPPSTSACARRQWVRPRRTRATSSLTRLIDRRRHLLRPQHFRPHEPDWIAEVVQATLRRLAAANHSFAPCWASTSPSTRRASWS